MSPETTLSKGLQDTLAEWTSERWKNQSRLSDYNAACEMMDQEGHRLSTTRNNLLRSIHIFNDALEEFTERAYMLENAGRHDELTVLIEDENPYLTLLSLQCSGVGGLVMFYNWWSSGGLDVAAVARRIVYAYGSIGSPAEVEVSGFELFGSLVEILYDYTREGALTDLELSSLVSYVGQAILMLGISFFPISALAQAESEFWRQAFDRRWFSAGRL